MYQNILINITIEKDHRYPTENKFKKYNVLKIKNLYFKINIIHNIIKNIILQLRISRGTVVSKRS